MDEFHLIERLLRWRGAAVAGLRVGPGDDAAVLRPAAGHDLVATIDDQVEGIHFEWKWLAPGDVGFRAGAACLSDLAAMGARPWAALAALAIPSRLAAGRVEAVQKGLHRVLQASGTALVGGNVSRARERFSLTLAGLGTVPAGTCVERRGARAGDTIWVSGDPGKAALGLHLLRRGQPGATYVRAYRHPRPRLELGAALRQGRVVTAMIDLSDGLAGDLAHVLGPGLGARLSWPALTPGPIYLRRARALGLDPESLVLHGGEDYELLFTVRAGTAASRVRHLAGRARVKVREIGVIERPRGIRLTVPGHAARVVAPTGFRHQVGR